jgi:hypothetical protein
VSEYRHTRRRLPREDGDVVAQLVSPRSASTTGSEFAVDAGFLKEV